MIEAAALVAAAYLLGSIPSAYLAARFLKGIDIRAYGSGNVGASNLMEHVGLRAGLALGVFDTLAKGAVPVMAARILDQPIHVQAAVALAALAGHNWSAYLRMTGGRGISVSIGILLAMSLWLELGIGLLLIGLVGRIVMKDTGLWSLAAFAVLPVAAALADRPAAIMYMLVGMALLLVAKRLTANWEPPLIETYGLPRALGYRLLWDRDVPRKESWTGRKPSSERQRG